MARYFLTAQWPEEDDVPFWFAIRQFHDAGDAGAYINAILNRLWPGDVGCIECHSLFSCYAKEDQYYLVACYRKDAVDLAAREIGRLIDEHKDKH